MDRITGSDALGMMEAYSAVYAPQELTEEQVWEEVELWVNSLVEEGYDLSEYTWEDMYEHYLNEGGAGPRATTAGPTMYGPNDPRRTQSGPYQSRFARPRNAGTSQYRYSVNVGDLGSQYRGQELQAAARARASQVGTPRQGTAGGPTTGGNTPIPARPVAQPSARPPAAQSPARPPAAQPPARPTAAPAGTSRPNAPTRPATPSYSGATGVRPVGTPLPTGAVTPVAGTPAQNATVSAPASRPSLAAQAAELRAMRKASQQRIIAQGGTPATPLVQSFDPFDVVMGYLIDEGYAENEEAASVIMANMSDEWREEIIDEANRAEQELGLSSRERERARNLQGNLSKPIFYQRRNSQLGNKSDSGMNRMHKRLTNKRRKEHEERRGQG